MYVMFFFYDTETCEIYTDWHTLALHAALPIYTTPLFVMLAGAYATRTGDLEFVERLLPALKAAIAWIERTCDGNPLGLLDYARGESSGLSNQTGRAHA